MQNLIKLAIWAAPAFVLALILILGRIQKNEAEFNVDAARFDRQFDLQQSDFSEKNDFWSKEEEAAGQRLKIAQDELDLAKGKVAQQGDILEKSLNDTQKKEDEK